MGPLRPLLAGLLAAVCVSASAAPITLSPSFVPGGELADETPAVWLLPTLSLAPATNVRSATLSFSGRNWVTSPNELFISLFDNPTNSPSDWRLYGSQDTLENVQSDWFTDGGFTPTPGQAITGLAKTFVDTDPTNAFLSFSYTFSAFELTRFNQYLKSGPALDPSGRTVGIAFDADGYFELDGLKLQLAVPDTASTLALLGSALGLFALGNRFCSRKAGKP